MIMNVALPSLRLRLRLRLGLMLRLRLMLRQTVTGYTGMHGVNNDDDIYRK